MSDVPRYFLASRIPPSLIEDLEFVWDCPTLEELKIKLDMCGKTVSWNGGLETMRTNQFIHLLTASILCWITGNVGGLLFVESINTSRFDHFPKDDGFSKHFLDFVDDIVRYRGLHAISSGVFYPNMALSHLLRTCCYAFVNRRLGEKEAEKILEKRIYDTTCFNMDLDFSKVDNNGGAKCVH